MDHDWQWAQRSFVIRPGVMLGSSPGPASSGDGQGLLAVSAGRQRGIPGL